jgi:hypothetical protein
MQLDAPGVQALPHAAVASGVSTITRARKILLTRDTTNSTLWDWAKRAYCTSVEWAIAGRIRTVSHSGFRVYRNATAPPYAEQWGFPAPGFSAFTDPLTR